MFYRVIILVVYSFFGMVTAFALNWILECIIIPNPRYYHTHEGGNLFNLLHNTPSWNDYYPIPSTLNILITSTVGLIVGLYYGSKRLKREDSE